MLSTIYGLSANARRQINGVGPTCGTKASVVHHEYIKKKCFLSIFNFKLKSNNLYVLFSLTFSCSDNFFFNNFKRNSFEINLFLNICFIYNLLTSTYLFAFKSVRWYLDLSVVQWLCHFALLPEVVDSIPILGK